MDRPKDASTQMNQPCNIRNILSSQSHFIVVTNRDGIAAVALRVLSAGDTRWHPTSRQDASSLGQPGVLRQVKIDFSCNVRALGDTPNDQRLSTLAVSGCEHAVDTGSPGVGPGRDVRSSVHLDTELLQKILFRGNET